MGLPKSSQGRKGAAWLLLLLLAGHGDGDGASRPEAGGGDCETIITNRATVLHVAAFRRCFVFGPGRTPLRICAQPLRCCSSRGYSRALRYRLEAQDN